VGTGWMKDEFDIYGVDFETRGPRFDVGIEVLQKLWAGGMVEYHGKFFDFPPLQISPAPSKQVPIYTGGSAPIALKRTARIADGWLGAGNKPEEVPQLMAELQRLRQAAGRAHLPFETIVGLSEPPQVDTFQRLEEAGMTSGVSYPFKFSLGDRSSVADKKRVMEEFAEKIIRHCR
jgi:alkanesulfonate monooxygenase SsuD/methylene tetrahydromethanopterin reductase-like flavin-dependent oxidoreductase (luciferase family)